MDFGSSSLYTIELWSQGGSRIADISHLAQNRKYTMQRNEAETLTFDLDIAAFEAYCQNVLGGTNPKTLIAPYVTDVKVKRGSSYLFGAQVVDVTFNMSPASSSASKASTGAQNESGNYLVTVTCDGYLNLFKDRYVTQSYTATERTTIAANIINATQSTTNGSVGVTIASPLYATGSVSDRTYNLDNVKTKLQELAALTDNPFDFNFTYDKIFTCYGKQGARRYDMNLIYGGSLSNVAGFTLSRSAATLYNYIWGIGSGSGSVALTSNQGDSTSQLNYYRREYVDQFSSVLLQQTLNDNVAADLALHKDILELPKITITSLEVPTGTFISVGDRIPLQVLAHPWLDNINGLYRVEQMDVVIDANDFETITLTFDSWGVNQSE